MIAAGFDRFEGERGGARTMESPLGLLEEERALAADAGDVDPDLGGDDDDFDVPEFLR